MRTSKAEGTPKDSNATTRKSWNNENIKQVTDTLIDAGYRRSAEFEGMRKNIIEIWIGPGKVPTIALQRYDDDMGFELWTPISNSMKMTDVTAELRFVTGKPAETV